MKPAPAVSLLLASALLAGASLAQERVAIESPGLEPSALDAAGALVEDWGTLSLELRGEGMEPRARLEVAPTLLDGVIPAARASWQAGGVALQATVFRGPAWPAGVDVLMVRLEETAGQEVSAVLALVLSAGASVGERTVSLGGRTLIALPDEPRVQGEPRDWGFVDEATALPGWASPASGFDPAFSNIRAGLGGVPISYRFRVEPKGGADVVLGFCESHWSSPGSRSMTCKVEGAPHAQVDPLALFGRHQPGGLLFAGEDDSGDGFLDVLVLPGPGSPDKNPILNAIWLLPPGLEVDPAQVVKGTLNALALRRVDVGGEEDQALHACADLEFPVTLKPGGSEEIAFLVACPGGAAPAPSASAWTAESLRSAARAVWEVSVGP